MFSPSKHQILVVDDEPSLREAMVLLLISSGYDVCTAEDGLGALQQLKRTSPDLIVSDLNMPQMSGYELLSVVRQHFPRILTVAMSGAYQGDAVPAGVIADSFYAKGSSAKNLLAKIAALIQNCEHRQMCFRSEQYRPAIVARVSDDDGRDSTSSLFQVL
jgi:CheY-like chemotaxis protein